ncbi:heavy metal translocating P-type ATPase [Halocatena salina]|uniref:Heavy metal translocating P-type ATPase n=1 Tax=Halocatena salina TaxID=2934340 RepID=A0A8T9ZZU9_9EURY|nr:heavy metal translocating P-type ATPase [Halocatena salina]UPM42076.1 heavy metal translocating P-type ATPase [Halocatena salina]
MSTCSLCDLQIDGQPITEETADGTERFCCRGCREIARLIDDTESESEEAADSIPVSVDDIRERVAADSTGSSVPSGADDAETAYRSVDGMHCKTCEGFIELLATETDGIYEAEASYATEMVRLVYDPDTIEEASLSDAVSRLGYHASAPDEEDSSLRNRLEFGRYRAIISVILAMPVMFPYLLFIYPVNLGIYQESFLYGGTMASMVFAPLAVWSTLIVLGLGYPIFRGAYVSLRVGQPNMDVLVSIAVGAAYLYSIATYVMGGRHPYFDVAVMVLVVVTVGNHVESRIKRTALGNRSSLTESRVTDAHRLAEDGTTETISVEACTAGDRLLVKPGERVPIDGTIVDGTAAVDESLITGESIPQTKTVGDRVLGGSVLTDSTVVLEVGPDGTSTIDRLIELLWNTKSSDSGTQRLVNRFAVVFVPLVLLLAAGTTGGWLLSGAPVSTAVMIGVSVLVISCPCSLGIATPLALSAGTRDASSDGILVLNDSVLERIDDSDIVVFDKTGTLTTGEMSVADVIGEQPSEILARAAAVERRASHPLAAAIDEAAPPTPDRSVSGFERDERAVSALVDDVCVVVGHPDTFDTKEWTIPDTVQDAVETAYQSGVHPTAVGWNGTVRGVITVHDTPRNDWEMVVSELAEDDREIVVLTGDDERLARRFGEHDSVDHLFAGVRPESKRAIVGGLCERGTTTMVGDGTNDAPALASADLGIAVASGTELAIDAADAVIMDDQLTSVPTIFELASATRQRIKHNLVWAGLYNAVAIPIAIAGLITPLLAAAAMAVSSLLVVYNSKRRLIPERSDDRAVSDGEVSGYDVDSQPA